MKHFIKTLAAFVLLAAASVSCNKLEVTLPKGPQGDQGIQGVTGKDGLTAYEVWVNAVKGGEVRGWDATRTEVYDYFLYLKGEKGDKGDKGDTGSEGKSAYDLWKLYISGGNVDDPSGNGKWDPKANTEKDFYIFLTGPKGADGLIPYIGDNGNWFIGDYDTGVPATGPRGPQGADGLTSYQVWVKYIQEGNDKDWPESDTEMYHYFKYLKGEKGDKGETGDTGATGAKGDNGKTPYIGEGGSWIVDGEDTGIPATGPKGDQGEDGLSAYEVWKREVTSEKGLVNPGNGVYDIDEYPLWPTDAVGIGDFYLYLSGKDGKSAYEIWKEYVAEGDVDNPQEPGTKWNPSDNSEKDFYVFLTGPKGDDGLIPYIGSNGNWFMGDTDSGIPATGPQGLPGEDGNTPYVGDNGNWFVDDEDTGVPAKGADGSDGKDGADGKSAYEIWKTDVLADPGLANPGNGVYDVDEYPLWPKTAVSVSDFWLYLKGKDGVDGKDGQDGQDGQDGGPAQPATPVEYSEEIDADKYNVAPVRALMKVSGLKNAAPDTTYEYVNPYSGGAAFIVTGPGPVIIPDCEVVFSDVKGNTYTKTSDGNGFVYLSRSELPEFTSGSPSASSPTKPSSFKFGGKMITDASKIGQTCKVPYQVGLTLTMKKATLDGFQVTTTSSLARIVEGKTESSCGGVDFPFWDESSKRGYKYYRSASAIESYYSAIGAHPSFESGITNSADILTAQNNSSILSNSTNRTAVSSSSMSNDYMTGSFGNGSSPAKVEVTSQVFSITSKNNKLTVTKPLPDYGLKLESSQRAHVPEIRYVGLPDVTGESDRILYPKVGTDPDSDDPDDKVKMKWTHYIVILGQTEFAGDFDLTTFGQCYSEGNGVLSGDTFEFTRYDSLSDYMATSEGKGKKLEGYINVIGTREGTKIDNHVALRDNGWDVRDLYDGFEVIFGSYSSSHGTPGVRRYGNVHYAGVTANFAYTEGTYKARLSGSHFSISNIQVIYDGFTK